MVLKKTIGGVNFETEKADEICDAIGEIFEDCERVKPPKYPCPKCGSWNVGNYDVGSFFQMRVYCKNYGFFGCRDGGDDKFWNDELVDILKNMGLL